MIINATTKLFALVGNPIEKSKSPELHNKWFQEHAINAVYLAFKLENFQDIQALLNTHTVNGLNITAPFKEQVAGFATKMDSISREIGSINTLVIKNDQILAYNTDIYGIEKTLENIKSNRFIILGAGGTARAIAFVLRSWGIKAEIYNRNPEKALLIAKEFNHNVILQPDLIKSKSNFLINTLPYEANETFVDIIKSLNNLTHCFDLNYQKQHSLFLKSHLTYIDGYQMLVEQARQSFYLWTGIRPIN